MERTRRTAIRLPPSTWSRRRPWRSLTTVTFDGAGAPAAERLDYFERERGGDPGELVLRPDGVGAAAAGSANHLLPLTAAQRP
ncbi:MAG: hypothetical protein IRZ21_07005 [Thermoleophilaceae bacterium]|nr:hypothetical protein [Thermoleophilaceae bacterium]